jgi:very-short-patch-repair endonuclease
VRGKKELKNTLPIHIAKQLRQRQTETEILLWSKLRDRQLLGLKFRRQQCIGNYIVDFACMDKKLLVEIDGGHHNTDETIKKDLDRTMWLKSKGYLVLRFWNNDIMENLDGVVETIIQTLAQKSPPHSNSLPRRGERIGG